MRRPTAASWCASDYESAARGRHASTPRSPRTPLACTPTTHRNVLFERRHRHGDVEGAFAAAAVVVRRPSATRACSASPLEPRGMIARWEGDAPHASGRARQVPHIVRAALARAFGLAERQVRVIVPDTGGGFGQKMHVMPEDLAVAAAARLIDRPVKWIGDAAREPRRGVSGARGARGDRGRRRRARASCSASARASGPMPARSTSTRSPPPSSRMGTATILPGPYRTPAYAYDVAGRRHQQAAARRLSRRRHDHGRVRHGAHARSLRRPARPRSRRDPPAEPDPARRLSVHLRGGLRLRQRRLSEGARDGARRWPATSASCASATPRADAGRLLGVGIACYTEYTGIGAETYRAARHGATCRAPKAATVSIAADGSVDVHVSFPVPGPGACHDRRADRGGSARRADRVGARLPARHGRPRRPARGPSRAAAPSPRAARWTRRRGRCGRSSLAIAAAALEASPADLVLDGGRVSVRGMPGRGVSVADLARIAHSAAPGACPDARALEVTEVFDPPGPTFSGAVHVASVEVDPETGRVTVRAYAVVEDCGPVINPMIVEGQIHGAVAQGIGEALGERLVYDESGQLLTGTPHGLCAARRGARCPTSPWATSRRPRRSRRAATRAWAKAAPSARPPPSPMPSPTRWAARHRDHRAADPSRRPPGRAWTLEGGGSSTI